MHATVLQKKHSLKGRYSTMALMKRYKNFKLSSPRGDFSYARLAANKKTNELSMDELELGFSTLTGESADDYCGLLSVTVTKNNLRQLLHVPILTANKLGHPDGQDLRVSCLKLLLAHRFNLPLRCWFYCCFHVIVYRKISVQNFLQIFYDANGCMEVVIKSFLTFCWLSLLRFLMMWELCFL